MPSILNVDSAWSSHTVHVLVIGVSRGCSGRPHPHRSMGDALHAPALVARAARGRFSVLRSSAGCPFLDVLEPLLEEGDDVVIVGDVVDVLAGAPRFHEPPATQQPELVGHRGLRQAEQLRQVAHRNLAVGERIEYANPRGVPQHLEGLGQRGDRRLVEQALAQLNI